MVLDRACFTLLLATTFLVMTVPLGCERPTPTWPEANELVIGISSAPIHLDPRIGTDQASGRVWELILNGLVTKTTEGNLVPDLAESWEVLDDGLRFRFHLRESVAFHDGRPFSARDVAFTYGSIIDGSVTSAKRGAFSKVLDVVAVDHKTVDFLLSESHGPLLTDLTSYVGVIPADSDPETFHRNPIGTGPFRLVERTPERVELVAFDGYWGGRPTLDRVILREIPDETVRALELRKGSIQLAVDLPPDVIRYFRADSSFQVVESPGSNYAYIGLHLEDPILSNATVRRAIAHAIDRKKIVEALWNNLGIVTETMIPPGHWARNEALEPVSYDPQAARRLLDQAGYPDPDGDGPAPRLELSFKTSTREMFVLQAQVIQAMLAEVGIAVEIRSNEFATFYADIKRGNFQMFSLVWTGIVDPNIYSLVLHSERIPPNGANRGRYRNARFDRLIDEGARQPTESVRRPLYLEAQQILADELPYISLYHQINVAVLAQPLTGYENYPSGELYGIKNVRWQR